VVDEPVDQLAVTQLLLRRLAITPTPTPRVTLCGAKDCSRQEQN
jgi:hypothetical protein